MAAVTPDTVSLKGGGSLKAGGAAATVVVAAGAAVPVVTGGAGDVVDVVVGWVVSVVLDDALWLEPAAEARVWEAPPPQPASARAANNGTTVHQ